MLTYAQIENGTITNVIVADADFANKHNLVLVPDGFGIGDLYANEVFTHKPEDPVTEIVTPTKEKLMAELAALTAKIQALE